MALPPPVGRQVEVVALPPRGHHLILGTAGSGKTTMAVHRAAHLGNPMLDEHGRTLLVTFNRSLLAYFDHLGANSLQNVDVWNYHRFARGYLNSVGQMGEPGSTVIASKPNRRRLIRRAVTEVRTRHPQTAFLQRDDEFFLTELRYMAEHGLLSLDTYLASRRVGRKIALAPDNRRLVFEIQETYLTLRDEEGFMYDWEDIGYCARHGLEHDHAPQHYKHIVIDEGQDFSPEMLRSLALAIPPDGSLTFFGDSAQQIYGRGVSWKQAGLKVGAHVPFEHNYRNTKEIAELGLAIADMPYYSDAADMVAPTGFRAAGPPPTLARLVDENAETKFVIEQANAAGIAGTVGVLFRRHEDARRFAHAFSDAQYLDRDLTVWNGDPGISYGPVHSAKGFEFDTVILVGLTADAWPDPQAIATDGHEEAEALDGRALYVGVTRARQNLIMTATGDLTPLLPGREGLWTELTI